MRFFNPVTTLALVLLATAPPGNARGEEAEKPPWNPEASAKYLDSRAGWWLGWSGSARGQGTACLSCHTTVPIALALPALAEKLKDKGPGAAEKRLIAVVIKRVENWDKIVGDGGTDKNPFQPFYGNERKPSALGTESVLNALILVNNDVRRGNGVFTKKALSHMWQQQQNNGAWLWIHFGMNPWENDGAYYGASLAALALGIAGKESYDQPALREKLAALKKYLRTQAADQPLHHRLVTLWASSRLPGILDAAERKKLVEEVAALQETDGGWSVAKLGTQKASWKSHGIYPEGVSDGYATGLAVLALKNSGVAADDPKLKRAIAWLNSRQKDGTWPAAYPNRPRDPQTDIGKFMRDAATSFAILALTEPVLK